MLLCSISFRRLIYMTLHKNWVSSVQFLLKCLFRRETTNGIFFLRDISFILEIIIVIWSFHICSCHMNCNCHLKASHGYVAISQKGSTKNGWQHYSDFLITLSFQYLTNCMTNNCELLTWSELRNNWYSKVLVIEVFCD